MAIGVYLLCAAASLICAVLLVRGYRRTRVPLLFWAALCFSLLVLTNSLLFIDLIIFPQIDLGAWRSGLTLVALGLFLYGLIFESET
jgi:uncharacterized protein DUF5985